VVRSRRDQLGAGLRMKAQRAHYRTQREIELSLDLRQVRGWRPPFFGFD